MRILHVIDAIGPGGPARSLLALMEHGRLHGVPVFHTVVALRKPVYMPLVFAMRRSGADMHLAPPVQTIAQAIEGADVVLVHFWNTPEIRKFLSTSWPSWRLVHWTKIMGSHPPQLLDPDLLDKAHAVIHTAMPDPERLRGRDPAIVIPGIADFGRLQGLERHAHDSFNVLYLGATNPGKLHPHFFSLMSRLDIPELRVTVCGGSLDPAQQDQSRGLRETKRLEVLPFREDIAPVMAAADVFGYALSADTYGTSDKSLQEAMFAGLPPVVFRHGGPARMIRHEETGLIADTEDDFVRFIERLHRQPDERARLGENARAYARENFAPDKPARRLLEELRRVCDFPKRSNPACDWALPPAVVDAARFLASIGRDHAVIRAGLTRWIVAGDVALDRYVSELPASLFTLEGGLIQWRNRCPDDAALRFWAGLWLFINGRFALAAREFAGSQVLGAPSARCRLLRDIAAEMANEPAQATDRARHAQLAAALQEHALPRLAAAVMGR